jgi:phage tail tape-measure protein
MVGAFVGGIAGAIFFTPLIPIPIVGTVIGGLLGSFAGAWIGEATAEKQRHPEEKMRAALGAAAGKLAGTFGKLAAGVVNWLLLVYGAFTN